MMREGKSVSATPFCKVCFKDINELSFGMIVAGQGALCGRCLGEMSPKESVFKVGPFKARALYEYNEKIRSLLFQFKAAGDIELGPLFIDRQLPLLKLIYHGYVMVPAPSYAAKEEKRGFNHVEEMWKPLGLPIVRCLMKTMDVKQANLGLTERKSVGDVIAFSKDKSVLGKKALFVDDVITTGSTALACASLLKKHGARKVRILVMGRTPLDKGG